METKFLKIILVVALETNYTTTGKLKSYFNAFGYSIFVSDNF